LTIAHATQLTTLIILLEKMTVAQLVNIFLAFNGTRKFRRSLTLDPILRQLNPIYNQEPYFFKISLSSQLPLDTTRDIFPSDFPTQICMHLSDGC
jgi:hypothetical protein